MGLQPNQTGPLNIAGGLEEKGNDLGSYHTSRETEIHQRQIERQTRAGRRAHLTLGFSPCCTHSKIKSNTGSVDFSHPVISAFVGLSPATGSPKTTSYGSSLTLVCSWQLRALFLPSASSSLNIFYHLLGPSLSLALCFLVSLPPASWGSSGHLSPSKGPTRPCLPSVGLTQPPHSL